MQAVLGPVFFATQKPLVIKLTAKPDKVLEGLKFIPLNVFLYTDGSSRHVKQKWLTVVIQKKYSIGGLLTVSEDFSITIMVGTRTQTGMTHWRSG